MIGPMPDSMVARGAPPSKVSPPVPPLLAVEVPLAAPPAPAVPPAVVSEVVSTPDEQPAARIRAREPEAKSEVREENDIKDLLGAPE